MRSPCLWALLVSALPAFGAQLKLDFADFHQGQSPTGFVNAVMGKGKPGDWRLVLDDVPTLLSAPASSQAPPTLRRAVQAQLAQDPTDEHFSIFIYEGETFGDFVLTTKV